MGAWEVIGILISLTALSSVINYRYLKLPKSIGLTLITLIFSLILAGISKIGWHVDVYAEKLLESLGFTDTFLHGMLGFLLFAASLHVNSMELAKHKLIVGLLATVSVVLSTLLVGIATFGLTHFLELNIPIAYCFVFGALISPTDPIATLGILKRLNAPKALEMKIAGEALFNDGMGIVLFVMILGVATDNGFTWDFSEVTWFLLRQWVGGVACGALMGMVAARLIRSIDNYEVATILTLAVVTGGYTLSHGVLGVSGAICMAVSGLIVGSSLKKGNMSKHTIQRLDGFWELLDEVLNSILFVAIGLEFLTLHFTRDTLLAGLGAIIITIAARWVSVIIPVGYVGLFRKFSPNVVWVMTWGGLRGGISIALALIVPQGPIRDFIVSITYTVVLFSITVQGLTMGALVNHFTQRDLNGEVSKADYAADAQS